MNRVMLCVFAFVVLSAPVFGEVLFWDDFEGGMDDAWIIPNGGWVVDGGRLLNTTTCGYQQCIPDIWSGGINQADYMINFECTLLLPSSDALGMALYVEAMFSEPCDPAECPSGLPTGYFCDIGYGAGGNIQRLDGGSFSTYIILVPQGTPQCWWEPNVTYNVKFGRLGGDMVFNKWAVGEAEPNWLMRIADDTYHSGYWGLGVWNGYVAIDNFVVEGSGAVPNESASFGAVKSLFR